MPQEPLFKSPVFIGGTGRSGTTLVARLLGYHPKAFVPKWETQFLVAPKGLLSCLEGGRAEDFELFSELMRGRWFQRLVSPGTPREYSAGLCEELSIEQVEMALLRLKQELDRVPTGNNAVSFLSDLYSDKIHLSGSTLFGEKTPANLIFADRLQNNFPDMRFVHVIRDGRDVLSSILSRSFWPITGTLLSPPDSRFTGEVTFESAVEYWPTVLRHGETALSAIPENRIIQLRLEDLIDSPKKTLTKLFDFLEIGWDDAVLQQPIRSSSVGRWKNDLTPSQAEMATREYAHFLGKWGYS